IRLSRMRDIRYGGSVQEADVGRAHTAPSLVGSTGLVGIARLSTPEKTGEPDPVPVKELHYLEQMDFRGAAPQSISAAISSRGVDDLGVSESPHDLGQIVRGNAGLFGK